MQGLFRAQAIEHSKQGLSTAEFDNAISQELALKSDQQALLRNLVSQQNNIEQLKTEQKQLPDDRENNLSRLLSGLSDNAQKIAELSGRSSRIIKAPRAGVVNNIQAREGHQVHSGNNIPLITLFPNDAKLAVHLLVPVRSIGFVDVGQDLSIRYDAFPYQKFGIYKGKITKVSKTLLLPNELLNSPLQTKEAIYSVTALLNKPDVQAYGKSFMLKPGMTLSADISLGNRTLIEWLLEPIYSLRGRL